MRPLFLLTLAFFVVVYGCYVPLEQLPEKTQETITCNNLKPGPELTFGTAYCMGDFCQTTCDGNGENCHAVTTPEECRTIDVVLEHDVDQSGKDGIPDCSWDSSLSLCRPNK
ncbi:hypothetical protein COY95_03965 [Candidatus Woesearchaeota archaeon CG_4_10_14_0_8_um_filter_47_5]|nr:MAG: hypothetical protein COY95_03965 [Candidatus Woesearchaeota archaeon CG_4_10_14_0_8_um_filter_47_5]